VKPLYLLYFGYFNRQLAGNLYFHAWSSRGCLLCVYRASCQAVIDDFPAAAVAYGTGPDRFTPETSKNNRTCERVFAGRPATDRNRSDH